MTATPFYQKVEFTDSNYNYTVLSVNIMALSVNTFEKPDVDRPIVSFEEEEEVNLITEDKEEGERVQPVAGGVNEVEVSGIWLGNETECM